VSVVGAYRSPARANEVVQHRLGVRVSIGRPTRIVRIWDGYHQD